MTAYLFANVSVTDPAGYDEYRKRVGASIEAYGGRFLARGGAADVLEGDLTPNRVVILEFPSMTSLKMWYDSPEYRPLLEIRKGTATSDVIAIEGIGAPGS